MPGGIAKRNSGIESEPWCAFFNNQTTSESKNTQHPIINHILSYAQFFGHAADLYNNILE